jgi:FemAB-related protein (PEP-CTERM system-associated)
VSITHSLQQLNSDIEIISCGQPDRQAWDEFVATSRQSNLAHLYCWNTIIERSYSHAPYYLMAREGSEIAGILPLIRMKSSLFGSVLCSMPFLDHGGILAQAATARDAMLARSLQLRDQFGFKVLELRNQSCEQAFDGRTREDKATLILDLHPGADAIWKGLPPKVRNQVRKAEKCGLHTEIGGAEFLDDFYRIFAVNMRDLGSPVHHPAFLANIFREFGSNALLMVVREGSKTVGGLIGLIFKDTLAVPWASSLREYFPKCPNNLLYWHAIEQACLRGCNSFDFGRSSLASGTYNFKAQWGAQPVPLCWQYFCRSGSSSGSGSESKVMHMASKLWSHLPVSLTLFLGPLIRKHLSN